MKNSRYVKNWFVTLDPNGVYCVVFNLTERGLTHHAFNENSYIFGEGDGDPLENHEMWESKIQEIPDFLPKSDEVMYLEASSMNKDQCLFYYIPCEYSWIKRKDKIIMKSEKS